MDWPPDTERVPPMERFPDAVMLPVERVVVVAELALKAPVEMLADERAPVAVRPPVIEMFPALTERFPDERVRPSDMVSFWRFSIFWLLEMIWTMFEALVST